LFEVLSGVRKRAFVIVICGVKLMGGGDGGYALAFAWCFSGGFCAIVGRDNKRSHVSMLRSKSFLWWEKRMVEDALATKGVK